jgi:hypothetical protein
MDFDRARAVLRHLFDAGVVKPTREGDEATAMMDGITSDLKDLDERKKNARLSSEHEAAAIDEINARLGLIELSTDPESGFLQPDYRETKNRPFMSMTRCIESPFLLMNRHLPGLVIDDAMMCLDDVLAVKNVIVGRTTSVRYEAEQSLFSVQKMIVNESKNPDAIRDIITWSWMRNDIDQRSLAGEGGAPGPSANAREMAAAVRDVPLDPSTRYFFIDKADNWESFIDYMKKMPDRVVGKRMALTIKENLLSWENADIEQIGLPKNGVRDLETSLISSHASKFPPSILEEFAGSKYKATRDAVACLKGLSRGTAMKIASNVANRKALAGCSNDCDVLEYMKNDPETPMSVLDTIKNRMERVCKQP